MDVIVDGYNMIGLDKGLQGGLEHKRNWLIQELGAYQKLKGFSLIVVFDGWQSGSVKETEAKSDGVRVIYSRLGEKADAVVVRIAREKGSGCVVVSSDREIRRAVERFGAVAVYAGEFYQILRSVEGIFADELSDDDSELPTDKKGNANQLGKTERRRLEKLKKLRLN